MSNNETRANTIAKNTLFLYMRSFMVMVIGIYSSRLLLNTLGINDYGICNLVGGVVAMFASLKSIFATTIQRFLNFEKGKGNTLRVLQVFNLSIVVQTILAIIFTTVVECVGLWLIYNKLNIPNGSFEAALFAFHFSVASAAITILGAPFDAAVIANERFNVFAGLAITNSVLKLLIILLIPLITFPRLKTYVVLMFLVTSFDVVFNFVYTRKFSECKLGFYWDKKLFNQISSFAGWSFFGNTAFALVNEGLNMLLNIFGGVALNAARGIAMQVKSSANTLANNLSVAIRPFVVQKAAISERDVIFGYIFRFSRLLFIIVVFTVSPIIVFCRSILEVWLVNVPQYTDAFVSIMMLHLIQRALHAPLDLLFNSLGQIKRYQIYDSITLFLALPLSYVALKTGFPVWCVFAIVCIAEVINLCALLQCAKIEYQMSAKKYAKEVGLPCLKNLAIVSILSFPFTFIHPNNIFALASVVLAYIVCLLPFLYLCMLNPQDQELIKEFVKKKWGK